MSTEIGIQLTLQGAEQVQQGLRQAGEALGHMATPAEQAQSALSRLQAQTEQTARRMLQEMQQTSRAMEVSSASSAQSTRELDRMGMSSEQLGRRMQLMSQQLSSAAQYVNQSLSGTARQMHQVETSAAQTAAAMRMLPAQFTDIFTSLAGGQDPLLVLTQQGGQLKDQFGGVGAAARAMGGYVAGLVTPLNLAAAAGIAMVIAYEKGRSELGQLERAVAMTGNTLGVTTGQLNEMAKSLSQQGFTQSGAVSALTELAKAGGAVSSQMEQLTRTALDAEKYLGQSAAVTAQQFKELANDPTHAVLKLNESLRFLTATQYEEIKSLEEAGRKTEAAKLAMQTYNDALKPVIDSARSNLGALEKSWNWVGKQAKGAWDAMLNIGRKETGEERLTTAREKLQQMESRSFKWGFNVSLSERRALIESQRQQVTYLERVIAAESQGAEAAKRHADQQAARIKWNEAGSQFLSKQARLEEEVNKIREMGAVAGISQAEIEQRVAAARAKSADGSARQAQAEQNRVAAIRAKTDVEREEINALTAYGLKASELTEGEKMVLKLDQQILVTKDQRARAALQGERVAAQELATRQRERQALERLLKAQADFEQARDRDYLKTVESVTELQRKADAMELEARMYGESQSAIEDMAIARLLERREVIAMFDPQSQLLDLLDQEVAARRRIAAAKDLVDGKQEAAKAAKDATREWRRAAEDIEKSLTDALLRGFESGKDFGQNLIDTLQNMFSTLVLRPVIQAVINPVAATLTGALGLPGAASAGQSGQGANPMSLASSASSAYNLLTTGVRDSISKGFTKLASSDLGQQLGLYDADAGVRSLTSSGQAVNSALQSAGGSMMAYGLSKSLSGGYQVGNGKIMDAATLVAGWFDPTGGLIAGAVSGAINRAFGRKLADSGLQGTFGGNEGFSGNSYQFYKGGWFSSDKTKTSALDPDVEAGLADQFRALQASTGLMASTLGLGTEAISSFTSSIQLSFQGLTEEQIQTRLAEEFAKVGESLASTALGTERYTRAGETAVQTMERMSSSLSTVNGTFDVLGRTLYAASLSGADMASQLIDQMGGLAQYQSTTTAYYQAYYTEAERNATATRQLTASLAALGLSLPTTRAAYRALVEAQDLTTDAGRRTYAALLGLSAQFDSLTPKLDTLAGKFGSLVAGLSDEATRLIDSQIQLSQGAARTAREASDAYRAAMTDLRSAAESILLQRAGGQSARAAYQAQLTRAQGGDVKAMQALPSLADALIAETKNSSRTAVEFAVASAQVANQLDGVAAVADVLGVGADYQAKLYDVNTSLLEVTREQLASGNLTVDLLQQIQTALGRVDGSIQASAQLTVGTMQTGNGGIVGALVDNAGAVVSSLDSTTVLQLAGMQGQTAAADRQAVSLGGLSKDQITKLQALGETQSKALGLTDLVAAATDGSETLLGAVLNRLSKQDSGTTDIVSALNRGNVDLLGKLAGIEAAIRQQSSDQAAELQRQQSLANAQASLEQYAGIQRATVDSVKQGIEALWSLASANGVDLLNDKGAKAYIYVSEDGLLGSNYQQTSTTSGDGYANYMREFYQSGGVYDQVYGKIGQLQSIAEDVKAARDLVVSLGGVPAYSVGGYTGPGAIDEPAGIVHKGEVVWSQDDVARAGGVQAVESLRLGGLPGFADGGAVGLPVFPIAAAQSDDGEVRALLRELVQQNRDLVQQNRELTRQMADLSSHVDRMRSENNIGNAQIVGETKSQSRILNKWEQVGMPAAAA